jgi:hypothetical protein
VKEECRSKIQRRENGGSRMEGKNKGAKWRGDIMEEE